MRWLRYGERAVLIECGSLDEVGAVRATLAAARIPGLTELVPGARSVLAAARDHATLDRVRHIIENADLSRPPAADPREITLEVHYDGADLDRVAEDAGLDVDGVIAAHTGAGYTVAFTGFAPGFGYLTGLPAELQQSRLDSPRTSVPAGSVGIAGEFTGVYPRSSPGGWRLIGHTDAVLFDPRADRPALLAPGDHVRFRAA